MEMNFPGNMFSVPIIPMKPAKYVINQPKRRTISRIIRFSHPCNGRQYHLKAIPINDVYGYEYHLICKSCRKIVGKLYIGENAIIANAIKKFINIVTSKKRKPSVMDNKSDSIRTIQHVSHNKTSYHRVVCSRCCKEWTIRKDACTICPNCGNKIGNCDE